MRYTTDADIERVRLPASTPKPLNMRVYVYVGDIQDRSALHLADRLAREFQRSFRVIPREGKPPEDGHTPETRYKAIQKMLGTDRVYLEIEGNKVTELPIV